MDLFSQEETAIGAKSLDGKKQLTLSLSPSFLL